MSIRQLLETKMVLTHDELVEALASQEPGRVRTKESLVGYYQRTGRLLRVRRGLYAVVPPGISPKDAPVDPYLLAANASKDAILAYHTALEIHGKAHSVFSKVHYLSHEQHRPWMFRDYSFQRVSF